MKKMIIQSSAGKLARLVLCGLLSVALVACGGGGSGNTVVDTPGVPLFTSASQNISLQAGASASYTVGGGGGGSKFVSYSASSGDLKIASVTLTGSTLTVKATGPGTTTVSVTDNAGASVSIALTVAGQNGSGSKLGINAPLAVTLTPGNSGRYKIVGGTGPFTTSTSSPQSVSSIIETDTVVATATNAGTATVVVFDATGASAQFSVRVEPNTTVNAPLYVSAPSLITMQKGASAAFTVGGGTGPYQTATGDARVASAVATTNSLMITAGIAGNAQLNVLDAAGASLTIFVRVIDEAAAAFAITAPTSLTIPIGQGPSYTILGGTAPYTATSSNPSVASGQAEANTISITGSSAGTASIVVFDSTGLSKQVSVTVTGTAIKIPMFTTAPSSIVVAVGASPTFAITGGLSPYTATSSDVLVATVATDGDRFTVRGVSNGTADVVVRDSVGSINTIRVTVQAP